jgi:transcriptional regulator GlxA family with amidase domain
MKIAYIIFDGITWLDFIGIYDPLSRLKSYSLVPGFSWDICAFTDTARDDLGLTIMPTQIRNNLSGYDAIVIPGGRGTRMLQKDHDFLDWIRTAAPAQYKISICTGSLLLGAAGFLKGHRATTHFDEYGTLQPYCREVVKERIVDDGAVITAGAVSASIDIGLYLCNKWGGSEAATMIRQKMDYRG